jgi:hypothetical protein
MHTLAPLFTMALSLGLAAALASAACGGGQTPAAEPSPGPPALEAEPAPPPRPAREQRHVYYQVFWREIHVLTVYAEPGPLRSADRRHPEGVLTGRSSYMSAASHWLEHEEAFVALIAQADSLEAFLDLLRANSDYRIQEQFLEEGY